MPGGEQRHTLVDDLRLAHRPPLVVAGQQQHGQQVAGVAAVRLPLADDAPDEVVQLAQGRVLPPVGGRRHPVGRRIRGVKLLLARLQQVLHQPADALRLRQQIDVEHRLGDDAQRQLRQFFVQCHRLPVLPAADHLAGVVGHRRGVSADAQGMEGGRDQLALPLPGLVLGDEDAVAHDAAQDVGRERVAVQQVGPLDDQLADDMRIGDEEDVEPQHLVVRHPLLGRRTNHPAHAIHAQRLRVAPTDLHCLRRQSFLSRCHVVPP